MGTAFGTPALSGSKPWILPPSRSEGARNATAAGFPSSASQLSPGSRGERASGCSGSEDAATPPTALGNMVSSPFLPSSEGHIAAAARRAIAGCDWASLDISTAATATDPNWDSGPNCQRATDTPHAQHGDTRDTVSPGPLRGAKRGGSPIEPAHSS